jgi:hypothetical protein
VLGIAEFLSRISMLPARAPVAIATSTSTLEISE